MFVKIKYLYEKIAVNNCCRLTGFNFWKRRQFFPRRTVIKFSSNKAFILLRYGIKFTVMKNSRKKNFPIQKKIFIKRFLMPVNFLIMKVQKFYRISMENQSFYHIQCYWKWIFYCFNQFDSDSIAIVGFHDKFHNFATS